MLIGLTGILRHIFKALQRTVRCSYWVAIIRVGVSMGATLEKALDQSLKRPQVFCFVFETLGQVNQGPNPNFPSVTWKW